MHYGDVIMGTMASQITSLIIVSSTVYSGGDQRKHQSSASLAFVRGIHRGPVNSPAQMVNNAENVSIWWRHHVNGRHFEMHFRVIKLLNLKCNFVEISSLQSSKSHHLTQWWPCLLTHTSRGLDVIKSKFPKSVMPWWCHQMETFYAGLWCFLWTAPE